MQIITYLISICFYNSSHFRIASSPKAAIEETFETDTYYIDTITIAFELNKELTKKFEYGNALDPFPQGFIIFDGEIDISDYENRFFVMTPFPALMLNQSQNDSLNTMSLQNYLKLDSILSNNKNAKSYKVVNKNIQLTCGKLKYEYKIYNAVVKSIYLKQDSIAKPIFSESIEKISKNNIKTNIFIPIEFIKLEAKK